MQASTVTQRLERTFGQVSLKELGKIAQCCRCERWVTTFRLAWGIIEGFSRGSVKYIADNQRAINALWQREVHYKSVHHQLVKR